LQILVKWWSEYPAELLQSRVVDPLQQYLTDELSTTKKLTVSVMNSIKVLAKVEEANQLGRQLPPEAFYNLLIRSAFATMLCLSVYHRREGFLNLHEEQFIELGVYERLGSVVKYTHCSVHHMVGCELGSPGFLRGWR